MAFSSNPSFIPVIDLFAGPGGLNEGFSHEIEGARRFKSVLSVEKEFPEHQTLSLRAFYRYFLYNGLAVPKQYYQYIQGIEGVTREALWAAFPEAAKAAENEALQFTLGEDDGPFKFSILEDKITKALKGAKDWLLIGGPPCQAYSLVGRSKQLGEFRKKYQSSAEAEKEFYNDPRHKLYRQYLRIIAFHAPSVFVMENVKGILSAKLDGKPIFPQIIKDLSCPHDSVRDYGWVTKDLHHYHILSFATGTEPSHLRDYLIRSERYGVPQARHRVILLGIRDDTWDAINGRCLHLTPTWTPTTVRQVLGDLPPLRSGISKEDDCLESWKNFLKTITEAPFFSQLPPPIKSGLESTIRQRETFSAGRVSSLPYVPPSSILHGWYSDKHLKTYLNHETRSHMKSDLFRYFYVSEMGEINKTSAQLSDFPPSLLPNHRNVLEREEGESQKFADRFKVQVWDQPSSTITSHISKDGHYFIHPDPIQCRSLTVREAARLQTFPDNYFFEGNRTEQYHQVGNAVPPYLAFQLSQIVFDIFKRILH